MNEEQTNKIEELNTVYNLINSVFKDKSNKIEIIEKLRPCFSLKVIPQRDIDKVYSALEKIDSEKIDLVEEFKYEEEKFDSKNIFETNSKSLGLSKFDLDLSVSIFSHKQSFGYKSNEDKLDSNSRKSSKIHCIHSIFISLFRIVIDFKDIKLSRQVNEELKEIDNSNVTEKKILLEKFVEKFGLYIPLELLVGGRINMCFDAENEEQKRQYHNILERDIECKLGGGYSFISGNVNVNYTSKNQQNSSSNSSNEIENLSVKMIGGDYLCKDDLTKWIKSFNIDNLQIIEYKTLIPIYCFIQGFEEKMKICLQPYDKIVLQEIFNSIENKFKNQEQNLYEGTSKNFNSWEIGITKDNYKSFTIYQKIISKKLIIDKNSENYSKSSKNNIICGEIPEGFIICGWLIKINTNSKPFNVFCSWERKKELNIIGSSCYKFKLNIKREEKNHLDNYVGIEYILKLFCINCDYLIPYSSYYNYYNQIEGHYFLNCDCYKRKDDKKENKQKNIICYYNISDDRILKSPRILKKEDKIIISNWIKPNSEIKFRLIFQTSKNGNLISTFYNKVNDISPTLILIKSKAGHIFGG